MIDVERVWQNLGITGKNVHVRVNDGGVDSHHVEFGSRFDHENSCQTSGYDVFHNEGIDNGYDDDGHLHDDDYIYYDPDSHGTAIAAIVGAEGNNGECSVGIAPGVTISACDVFSSTTNTNYWEENMSVVDISQNSYGSSACSLVDEDDDDDSVRNRILQGDTTTSSSTTTSYKCPFTYKNDWGTYPCDVCGTNFDPRYFSPSTDCKETIVEHCTYFYEHDTTGCLEFLDMLLDGGHCEYNILHPIEREQMVTGITKGRNGKGIIYVFASGNDNGAGADTNMEGYLNSRFTISVGAVGKDEKHASYSTSGASLFVTAPGGDTEAITNIVSAYAGGGCYEAGLGTSYSCPVVSGVIALMLEANPNLSWRDVQGIIAASSRMGKDDSNDDTLTTNAAGFSHSNYYGFGIINAFAAVTASLEWIPYGPEKMIVGESGVLNLPIIDDGSSKVLSTITIDSSQSAVTATFRQQQQQQQVVPDKLQFFTESVVVYLNVRHLSRGDLEVVLKSPQGTVSRLHPGHRPENTQLEDDERWKLLTVRSWGEVPFGGWKLSITDSTPGNFHECVDAPWGISDSRGRRVECDYFERYDYCVDGAVNMEEVKIHGDEYLLTSVDADEGISATKACCLCGGGRSQSNGFENVLVEWQLVVYGHYYLAEDGIPIVSVPTSPRPEPTHIPMPAPVFGVTTPTQAPNGLVGPTVLDPDTSPSDDDISSNMPIPTRETPVIIRNSSSAKEIPYRYAMIVLILPVTLAGFFLN